MLKEGHQGLLKLHVDIGGWFHCEEEKGNFVSSGKMCDEAFQNYWNLLYLLEGAFEGCRKNGEETERRASIIKCGKCCYSVVKCCYENPVGFSISDTLIETAKGASKNFCHT